MRWYRKRAKEEKQRPAAAVDPPHTHHFLAWLLSHCSVMSMLVLFLQEMLYTHTSLPVTFCSGRGWL